MQTPVVRPLRRAAGLLAITCCALGFGSQAQSQDVVQSSPANLEQAIEAARTSPTGLIIELAPGTYDSVEIYDLETSVMLRPADPNDRPTLLDVVVERSSNVTLQNLVLDFRFDPMNQKLSTNAFRFVASRNIVLDGIEADGDLLRETGTEGDGYPAGRGIVFRDVHNVELRDSVVRGFWLGVRIQNSSGVTLRNNRIYGMRKDHVALTEVQDILITENHFGAYNRSRSFRDHPDMIQMWSKNTTERSERVSVIGNVFNSGRGPWSQTIWFRNEEVDKNNGGRALFYRDIRIEDNVIINAHRNAIYVGESEGVTIRNNTLIRNFISQQKDASDALASPRIRVAEDSTGVVIERNVAHGLQRTIPRAWLVRDNVVIHATNHRGALPYRSVFQNGVAPDPEDIASYYYKPGGPLHRAGLGSSLLDQLP